MPDERPPYGPAALAGLAALLLYVATLAPTTAFWDTSEYIATAHIVGIPHPPGNPLFVLLARSWVLLLSPLGLPVAVRVNLLAAVTTAAAVGFFFLVAHRVTERLLGHGWAALAGASASALLAATAFTVWNQANVNEKVYTVSVLVIAAVSWLGLRWADRAGQPGSERYLLVALFLMALGSTNHLMSVLPAPALAVLVLATRPGVALRPRFLARAGLLVVVGLSFNFVLPVRAADDPAINEGDPTCSSFAGAAVAVYTNGAAGCPALAYNLARGQYQKPPLTQRMAPFGHQLLNYWQYFEWQWGRGVEASELPGRARLPLGLLFLALGLCGSWAALRVDARGFLYLVTLAGTLTVGLVYYLNFKYGYSVAPGVADRSLHEVRERDYFFVASFLVWGTLAGMGLAWTWAALRSLSGSPRAGLVTAPVLAVALLPLPLNWAWASRAGDWAARDWGYDLLMSVEPYAVLFTNGDNDTFPLWYLQEVEGVRRDVTVIVGQYLFTDWYPRQLRELSAPGRQRPFLPERSAGVYEDRVPPEGPIVELTPDRIDGVDGVTLERDLTLPLGEGVAVTYPAGSYLNREQQLTLAFIHDSIDERPIYFSSAGGTMADLGLDRWGVREGLTTRLVMRDLDAPRPERYVTGAPEYGGATYDVDRSLELYREVYLYRSIRDRPIWQDRATLNIPWMYYAMALQLSDVARAAGVDREIVRRLEDDAIAFQVVSQGGAKGTPGA